jgi:hypothetical protein
MIEAAKEMKTELREIYSSMSFKRVEEAQVDESIRSTYS